ncbi:MAG: hypothetical protein Q9M94_05535 [Candidatus Gracilibacteria bacterium]|nr:hypothetical protein [Candidatus Gracilibacteria bacterium]
MINGIEGQFGSGKSSLATFIASEVQKISNKYIKKGQSFSGNLILSNIKMDKKRLPNYYYFEDDKFLELLRTCNSINDIERFLYTSDKKNGGGLKNYQRKKFTKFYIFFDEAGAIANNQNKLENNAVYAEYINQNRKNFQEIYIITAKGEQTNKTLRRMVDWWYYVKPFANFPILKDIGVIRRQQKDDEGKILTQKYIGKDDKGDDILKEKPVDEYYGFFFKPTVWGLYDDLHKNIADSDKYSELDLKLMSNILDGKPELKKFVFEENDFKLIKENLKKDNLQIEEKSNGSFIKSKINLDPNLKINNEKDDTNIKQNFKLFNK